jgi:hypothetical protein
MGGGPGRIFGCLKRGGRASHDGAAGGRHVTAAACAQDVGGGHPGRVLGRPYRGPDRLIEGLRVVLLWGQGRAAHPQHHPLRAAHVSSAGLVGKRAAG